MQLDGLDDLSIEGHRLYTINDPIKVLQELETWIAKVAAWLVHTIPDSGLAASWIGKIDVYMDWDGLREHVAERLRWLARLPTEIEYLQSTIPAAAQLEAQSRGRKEVKLQTTARVYVDPDRINEIKEVQNTTFDLTKLVRLCEEINVCFAGECYLAILLPDTF